MAHKFKLDFDGQSVVQADYNGLAIEASTGEDHVYAELFRLTPGVGSIARGVIPYGTTATIVANGASGSVLVNPFRVIIGTRTAAATDAVANWQDVRSSLSIADGSTSLTTLISLPANASGSPRWDAIYAAVTIDAVSTPVTRKVKNPGTAVVTDESVSVYSRTAVAVTSATGTPAATPTFPAIPSDAGNVYYVLLGYVRVVTGFSAGSTVLNKDIYTSTPVLSISSVTGASTLRPADQSNIPGGTAISGKGTSANSNNSTLAWTGTTSQRPPCYLPPGMTGSESLILAMDFIGGSSANWSHATGAIVDASRDWRNRLFKWTASVGPVIGGSMPWSNLPGVNGALFQPVTASGSNIQVGYASSTATPCLVIGCGHSFTTSPVVATLIASGAASATTPLAGFNVPTIIMPSATSVTLSCDSSGRLIVNVVGLPGISILMWLDASAQYPNV